VKSLELRLRASDYSLFMPHFSPLDHRLLSIWHLHLL
jgi:hypothetical protein